jgi:hypothetical protein
MSTRGGFSFAALFSPNQEPPFEDPALSRRFSHFLARAKGVLQIGAYGEGENAGAVNLEDVVRPGSRLAVPVYNFGDLKKLTQSYLLPAVQTPNWHAVFVEAELLWLLDRAAGAGRLGHEEAKSRFLARYIGVLQKASGQLLPAVQADALIAIARAL